MTHTPEPWRVQKNGKQIDIRQHPYGVIAYISKGFVANPRLNLESDAARIVACINGCAGLNPAAYRACVEALNNIINSYRLTPIDPLQVEHGGEKPKDAIQKAITALTHAEEKG